MEIDDLNPRTPDVIREFKANLKMEVLNILRENKAELHRQLLALQEAAAADTKSSAGDKYETGRESIRQSRTLLEKQWHTLGQWESTVQALSVEPASVVREGALLLLDIGWIWVAASFGKMATGRGEIQGVSAISPLVQVLKGKGKGETAHFRGHTVEISDIL
ncbi:hypothetical protein [Cyclobacterium xiamenense]|uniref:hypothetical protein n=1 Tax=Cyclobacterium xiamenense TaxID=1297121 RepID=UPI0035CF005A